MEEEAQASGTSSSNRGRRRTLAQIFTDTFTHHSSSRRNSTTNSSKPTKAEVESWGENIQNLLHSKLGKILFHAFLRKEYCEENIEFWEAVEEFKESSIRKLQKRAKKIVAKYIAPNAPKQINLDSSTLGELVELVEDGTCITHDTFNSAQSRLLVMMESGSYRRFLHWSQYLDLLNQDNNITKSSSN